MKLKNTSVLLALALSLEGSFSVKADNGSWVTDWLIAGPISLSQVHTGQTRGHLHKFQIDYLQTSGGEAHIKASENAVFTANTKTYTWVHGGSDSIVDLDRMFPHRSYALAYAYKEIDCTRPGMYFFSLGSDDGMQMWLNGELVWDVDQMRGVTPDEDLIPVRLRAGKNSILIKIENYTHDWGFCLRLLPFDIKKMEQRSQIFDVVYESDNRAFFRINYPPALIKSVFVKGHLKITQAADSTSVISDFDWNPASTVNLQLHKQEFNNYALHAVFTLIENQKCSLVRNFPGGKRETYSLFAEGKTRYAIILDPAASESEKWAAKELQKRLKEISGIEFPIQTELHGQENQIVLGYNLCASLLKDSTVKKPDSQDESFTYCNSGSNILIWGGTDRGTLYGVISFLEREFGCRWYSPRVQAIPPKQEYCFTRLFNHESPGVAVRNDFYFEAFDSDWAAHNKLNGFFTVPLTLPGGGYGYWWVHTFYRFIPPFEFFPNHPEYFSLINGKREWTNSQLCLTNPDVLKIISQRMADTIRSNPQYLIYCLSQNDCLNPCQCENCQALAAKEGSESGPVIWFVNQVAKQIEKEFPDKYIGTLAYQYSRKPCKNLIPRNNVVVRLCSIEGCFSHPLNNCTTNQSFISDLKGWAAIAPHLYIWDYVVNFRHYMMPYPNFQVLQPNIQTFAQNKAIGIMEQGAYQSRGGELAELRAYLIAKLLWNPYASVDEIVNDFIHGYYGRSGQYVRQYYDLLMAQVRPDTHINLLMDTDHPIFTDEFIQKGEVIFDRAETVADSEEIRQRVEMARLPLMYLKFRRQPNLCKYDGTLERLKTIVAREGITHYSELGEIQQNTFTP
jgi:hypothetical protein